MDWPPLKKPAEIAESRLIKAILSHDLEINTFLPAERDLAARLGVTRPTLREALQRLERDGWLEIHQGKPTRIRNYWQEGNLGLLNALITYATHFPPDFIGNLLSVRLDLAPSYVYLAISSNPDQVVEFLQPLPDLPEDPQAFTSADWQLHHLLTVLSGNPIYTLITNGFDHIYQTFGVIYFSQSEARDHSRKFYQDLLKAGVDHNPVSARIIAQQVMAESIQYWQRVNSEINDGGIS